MAQIFFKTAAPPFSLGVTALYFLAASVFLKVSNL